MIGNGVMSIGTVPCQPSSATATATATDNESDRSGGTLP
jgi:hypothetical protein